ncbi:CoA-binding protein [Thermodesulfobacteriota bacterium]
MTDSESLPISTDTSDNELKDILGKTRKIAVVGLSPKEQRDSNRVARYLLEKGYDIIPVNPGQREILGKKCYKSLSDIPGQIDIVNIFLNPSRVPPVVDQAITSGVEVVWMQLGIVDKKSAEKARNEGIRVVMDRCIKQEYERLMA